MPSEQGTIAPAEAHAGECLCGAIRNHPNHPTAFGVC